MTLLARRTNDPATASTLDLGVFLPQKRDREEADDGNPCKLVWRIAS